MTEKERKIIEIKRNGIIEPPSYAGRDIYYRIIHESEEGTEQKDDEIIIAQAAIEAGYHLGDLVEYKIVIESKED
jgi:hypothetical protein